MKVYVKEKPDGPELAFPTYGEFVTLWKQKFISDDDLVRREGSTRWVRAGDLPELRAVKRQARRAAPWRLYVAILLTSITLAIVIGFIRATN